MVVKLECDRCKTQWEMREDNSWRLAQVILQIPVAPSKDKHAFAGFPPIYNAINKGYDLCQMCAREVRAFIDKDTKRV